MAAKAQAFCSAPLYALFYKVTSALFLQGNNLGFYQSLDNF
jgi:hypothetical protein